MALRVSKEKKAHKVKWGLLDPQVHRVSKANEVSRVKEAKLVLLDHKALRVLMEHRVQREIRANKVPKVKKEIRETRAKSDPPVGMELMESEAHRVRLDHKVLLVPKAKQVLLALPEKMASMEHRARKEIKETLALLAYILAPMCLPME